MYEKVFLLLNEGNTLFYLLMLKELNQVIYFQIFLIN